MKKVANNYYNQKDITSCGKMINAKIECQTADCLKSANYIDLSMDRSVDPCTDFYKFTCGNWAKNHHPSQRNIDAFGDLQQKLTNKIVEYYSSSVDPSEDEPEAVKKSRNIFNACRNTEVLDAIGYRPILETLSKLSVPTIPSFFKNETLNDFDWVSLDARARRTLGLDLFISSNVVANNSNLIGVLVILHPERKTMLPSFTDSLSGFKDYMMKNNDSKLQPIYTSFMIRAMRAVMGQELYSNEVPESIESKLNGAAEMILTADKIFQGLPRPSNIIEGSVNELDLFANIILESIQSNKTNIFGRYLNILFENITEINGDEFLYMSNNIKMFYQDAIPQIERNKEMMELYAWWLIIESTIMSTTTYEEFYWKSFPAPRWSISKKSREEVCADIVMNNMDLAVAYAIYKSPSEAEIISNVTEMVSDIYGAFKEAIQKSKWLDEDSKTNILRKGSMIKKVIGYPSWLFNDSNQLNLHYKDVHLDGRTHLKNMISLVEVKMFNELKKLHKRFEYDFLGYNEVNAAYNPVGNEIQINRAIINFPFYQLGLPYLNYGLIGAVLSHELTHAFGPSQISKDENGFLKSLLTNDSFFEYDLRMGCYAKQYSGFFIEQIQQYGNGNFTAEEIIADNGGLHLSYRALEKYLNSNPQMRNYYLPGFGDYTPEQMFFIAYGGIFKCNKVIIIISQSTSTQHTPSEN